MKKIRTLCYALALGLFAMGSASGVEPDEILDDPALEARARELSAELRCMVCQNQSIDDSEAELARDLRVLVRERLQAGDSDEEVLSYIVSRYGEFVLLKPQLNAQNAVLWAAPILIFLSGGLLVFLSLRRRSVQRTTELSAEEEEELKKVLEQ